MHSVFFLVEVVHHSCGSFKGILSLLGLELHHSSRLSTDQADLVPVGFLLSTFSKGTSKHISVLLLWEVHIIVPMGMWVLDWIISIILPGGVTSHVLWMSMFPALNIKIADRSSHVVARDGHGSLVGLIVDSFGSEHPLSLLSETLKDVVWANLHDGDFIIKAGLLAAGGSTSLVLLNFSEATLWNEVWLKSHVF
jgi:hypothetical protein